MKAVTPLKNVRRSINCTGREENFTDQTFEIEASDVGQNWPHYGGHNHSWYKIQASDIGRHIMRTKQGNHYQCWNFVIQES